MVITYDLELILQSFESRHHFVVQVLEIGIGCELFNFIIDLIDVLCGASHIIVDRFLNGGFEFHKFDFTFSELQLKLTAKFGHLFNLLIDDLLHLIESGY